MALILNIDTSLETANISIARDGNIIASAINEIQKEHASFLHEGIHELLREQKLNISDLTAIACTLGPGSYTGLRVGLTAAKGLAYTLQKPLITISTLQAMAKAAILNNVVDENYYYCPLIDARRMEVFTALYTSNLDELQPPHAQIITPQVFDLEALKNKIYCFGSGMPKCKEIILNKNVFFLQMGSLGNAINILSYNKLINKDFDNVFTAAPHYAKEFYNP